MDLNEVLDWAADTLNRVDRAGSSRPSKAPRRAIFLRAVSGGLRPRTAQGSRRLVHPAEIVGYMVERVDRVLREELALPDGLADPNVYVLDPCCGTGAYWSRCCTASRDPAGEGWRRTAAPGPQAGRPESGVRLRAPAGAVRRLPLAAGTLAPRASVRLRRRRDERAGMYPTNALTGWEPPSRSCRRSPGVHPAQLLFEFEEERDAAAKGSSCEAPILVVLGNPPYNGYAGVGCTDEEADLIEPYKRGLLVASGAITKPNYLDDLYVRFFRLAERSITSSPRAGWRGCFDLQLPWLG